ncbi:MAG: GNAT family N-acetyltransferase [Candidatus Saccharicenans sp.]|nr:GNAT family N-acetyltransferase [Candidatus Saccharicenans sp.]
MTTVSILAETEYHRWDHFVDSHPAGWLTHFSQWHKILSGFIKECQLFIFAINNEQTGEITAGLPLYFIKSPFSGKRFVGAPLATFFDPLISNPAELKLLIQAAKNFLEQLNGKYIKIKIFRTKDLFLLGNCSLKSEYVTHILSLDDDLDKIFSKFDRTCIRKNIRKAEKSNLKTRIIKDQDELSRFFLLYSRTRKRLGLPAIPFSFYSQIFNLFGPSGKAIYLLAEHGNIPVASLLIFLYKNRCSTEALGWETAFKSLRPVPFIYWEAIKLASQRGFKYFDFGRTSIEHGDLLFFKRNWGTEEIELPEFIFPDEKAQRLKTEKLKIMAASIYQILPSPVYFLASHMYYRFFLE